MRPRSRFAFVAACLFVFLLLEVIPVGAVVVPLGLCAAGCLLVVDVPHAWRSIRRR